MSHINYITGISRKFDYCKIAGAPNGHEGAMVIFRDRIKGKSFWITESAMWKYLAPDTYKGDEQAVKADAEDFWAMAHKFAQERYKAENAQQKDQAQEAISICGEALQLTKHNHYYLCVAFNLIVCMRGLEITPCKQPRVAAAQLLLWIQSKLPDLKNIPPYDPAADPNNPKAVEGHVDVKMGDNTIVSTDLTITETGLIERENLVGMN